MICFWHPNDIIPMALLCTTLKTIFNKIYICNILLFICMLHLPKYNKGGHMFSN